MNLDEGRLFRALEPPPGGVEGFRRRLEARRKRAPVRLERFAIAGLAVFALALIVAIAITRDGEEREPRVASIYEAPEFDRLLGRPMAPARVSITIDGRSASVSEVRGTRENVRIYMIESD